MSTIIFICLVVVLGIVTGNGFATPLKAGFVLGALYMIIEGLHRYFERKHAPYTPREAEAKRLLKEEQRAHARVVKRITDELGTWTGSWEDAVRDRLREWRKDRESKK